MFTPLEPEDKITAFGEIVYVRSVLDFSVKNQQPGVKKDEVLEENMLDVRRILKNSMNNNTMSKKGLAICGVESYYKKKDP